MWKEKLLKEMRWSCKVSSLIFYDRLNNKNNLHEFYKIRGRYKKLYNQDFIKMMLSTDVANFIKIKSLLYKFGLYKFFKKLVKK